MIMYLININNVLIQAKTEIKESKNLEQLEVTRIKYLGKKGYFTQQISNLTKFLLEERSVVGNILNQAKNEILELITQQKFLLKQEKLKHCITSEAIDISLPGRGATNGSIHPISSTIAYIEFCFNLLGFETVYGQEIEDNYHNFDALNIPINHPSRTNHDSFWLNDTYLLRTQTSGTQIHLLKERQPPIRVITSGRVYRNDHDDTHTPMFHQIEGICIDKNICFAHLKGILNNFIDNFFQKTMKIRFRPSYFPFTEPSAEIDVLDKNGVWLEVLGCGMIHPKILNNAKIDSKIYSGFALGMGVERLTMLRHGITDSRIFFENDLRFLKQFNLGSLIYEV